MLLKNDSYVRPSEHCLFRFAHLAEIRRLTGLGILYRPAVEMIDTGEQVQQTGFSGSGRSHDHDKFAFADLQIHIVNNFVFYRFFLIFFGQGFDLQQLFHVFTPFAVFFRHFGAFDLSGTPGSHRRSL